MKTCIDCNATIKNNKAKRCRSCYIKSRQGHLVSEYTKTLIKEKRKKQIPPMLNKKHSKETMQKMKKIAKDRKISKDVYMKGAMARKGKPAWNRGISAYWLKGNKSNFWKGGITPESQKRMNTIGWNIIRKKIYARDNWTCQICKKHCHSDIQCHHIIPYRITKDDTESNLITLCVSCHIKEERKYYNNL